MIALSCSFLAIDFSFLRCFILFDSLGLFVFLMVMVPISWVRLFSIVLRVILSGSFGYDPSKQDINLEGRP